MFKFSVFAAIVILAALCFVSIADAYIWTPYAQQSFTIVDHVWHWFYTVCWDPFECYTITWLS